MPLPCFNGGMDVYELAKQLKDAGYPQNPVGGQWVHDRPEISAQPNFNRSVSYTIPTTTRSYLPTLEELIEACGEQFGALEQWHSMTNHRDKWTAFVSNREESYSRSTPKEAVARLWLALNQSDKP
jgi:hypothetical protein